MATFDIDIRVVKTNIQIPRARTVRQVGGLGLIERWQKGRLWPQESNLRGGEMREIRESDWKLLRKVHPEALERFCKQILTEVKRINSDGAKG